MAQDSGLTCFARRQVPTKLHPKTGEPLVEWVFSNGKVVRPIMGASPDDPDDQDPPEDKDKQDPPDDSGGSGSPNGGGEDGDKVSKEELEALERRMKAADRRASEAERKLKEIEDAKKDDLTKTTDELTEVKTKLEQAQSTIAQLRLQNSFLTANKHTWHDGDTALALANSKGYLEDVLDEEGNVDKKALSGALDKLAKEHPYLVKKDEKQDDDNPPTPSGQPAGGRKNNREDEQARRETLKKRFPVLNR